MPPVLRLAFLASLAAGLTLSVKTASGFCVSCECSVPCGPPNTTSLVPVPPLQPSFHVEQGPTYHAVIMAEDDVERRLEFSHPHYFPYIRYERRPGAPGHR